MPDMKIYLVATTRRIDALSDSYIPLYYKEKEFISSKIETEIYNIPHDLELKVHDIVMINSAGRLAEVLKINTRKGLYYRPRWSPLYPPYICGTLDLSNIAIHKMIDRDNVANVKDYDSYLERAVREVGLNRIVQHIDISGFKYFDVLDEYKNCIMQISEYFAYIITPKYLMKIVDDYKIFTLISNLSENTMIEKIKESTNYYGRCIKFNTPSTNFVEEVRKEYNAHNEFIKRWINKMKI